MIPPQISSGSTLTWRRNTRQDQRSSDVAESGPLPVVLARLHGGGDEGHAFYPVFESRQQSGIGLGVAADDFGELRVERREGFEVALGMAAGDADIHRGRHVPGNGSPAGQELLGL